MKKHLLLALALLVCANVARAETPDILTDIPPVQSLVAQVTGPNHLPEVLLAGQEDPHHFQLRPSQMRDLTRADLVVWVGEGLTPWLGAALKGSTTQGASLALLPLISTDEEDVEQDHDDHDHHVHGDTDPHAWLNPDNAIVWLQEIAETLSYLDPKNADTYRANAISAAAEIKALSAEIQLALADKSQIPAVVQHDAFGHFETRFGIEFAGALHDSEAAPASAARMADLQDLIQTGSVKCIFTEPTTSSGALHTLAIQYGLKTIVLDPLGTELEHGPQLYTSLLQTIVRSLVECEKE